MSTARWAPPPKTRRAPTGDASRPAVLATCIGLVLAHTAFRAWAVFGAWFQEDDFEFLRYSSEQPLDLDYLMTPHSGHLMPLGRLLIDLSVAGGLFNWPATAAVTVAPSGRVAVACLWMLRPCSACAGASSPRCWCSSSPPSPCRRPSGGPQPSTRSPSRSA